MKISIHALLAESDTTKFLKFSEITDFYPRSPCGERLTAACIFLSMPKFLSTLSLRRATGLCLKISVGRDFYPRSPCGERLPKIIVSL